MSEISVMIIGPHDDLGRQKVDVEVSAAGSVWPFSMQLTFRHADDNPKPLLRLWYADELDLTKSIKALRSFRRYVAGLPVQPKGADILACLLRWARAKEPVTVGVTPDDRTPVRWSKVSVPAAVQLLREAVEKLREVEHA